MYGISNDNLCIVMCKSTPDVYTEIVVTIFTWSIVMCKSMPDVYTE